MEETGRLLVVDVRDWDFGGVVACLGTIGEICVDFVGL